jgi:hypothetical protein
MTIKTFDSNRVGGGTFSVEQDASTGEYKLKETGFLKLPELKLPELGTTTLPPVTGPVPTPDEPAINDPCPPGYKLIDGVCRPVRAGGDGGGRQQLDYTGTRALENIQKEATGKKIEDTKIKSASDIAYQNYKQVQQNYKNAIDQDAPSPELRQLSLDLDKARANVGMSTTGDMKVGAPGDPGFEGPDRGIIEPSKPLVDPITGAGRSQSAKFKERFDPTEIQAADPVKKNIVQKAADFLVNRSTFKVGVQALGTGMETIAKAGVAIGDTLLGVTDVDRRRREADSSAAKSLGYTTVGELGGSTDPGRIASVRLPNGKIATSSADSVFVGFNRDSAKGNLSQAAANRIETRMSKKTQDRLISKYGSANHPKVVEFNNKTKDFQKEANAFNSKKEAEKKEKSQNPNLRAGAGGEGGSKGGGKIVCTMMNESYGFGSFRNKIWLRHSKNLAPEYQIGYHRIFLPLVKKAKTNKVLKKILEHIAIHRTIDIRQEERNKIHLLGRVYRTILEPICYWVGKI